MDVFDVLESEVRSYCRTWPVVFDHAAGSWMHDEAGRPYLDFFAGAGALNYGHNNPLLRDALLDYLCSDRVIHSLDMFTVAKRDFLITLDDLVLRPRGLDYKVQFPGPAGTNAVEAALKLARKVTGRTRVICFDNAFHGASLGSLAVTANPFMRACAGVALEHATRLPFSPPAAGAGAEWTTGSALELLDLELGVHGPDQPAAVILETVQGEGGINVAAEAWLRGVEQSCRRHAIPLIVDDVQMGCGRTGPFFSCEQAGIVPDIICLSKSISGYGLPLALTLIRPELDVWEPGEHNGTFRGFNPALVTAAAAVRAYWSDDRLETATARRGARISAFLEELVQEGSGLERSARGCGMAHGLAFASGAEAARVGAQAFDRGLLVERCGPGDEVVKLMAPLTIGDDELEHGLALLADAVRAVQDAPVMR